MKVLLAVFVLSIPFSFFAQYEDIAPGWQREKSRLLIIQKMDELIDQVSFDYDCEKEKITYLVKDKHLFYGRGKDDLHFPKHVMVKACGVTYKFICECAQNEYGKPKEWIKGEWILIPDEEEK